MTATTTPDPATAPAVPARGGMPTKLIAMAAGALVLGGAVGLFVVGPRLGGGPKPQAVEKHQKEETKHEPPKIVNLENIIVNPAGTLGQRFLIVSVAVEVETTAAEERLKRSEVPFRDAVTGLLERMTLAQLTQLGARDSVRGAVSVLARRFAADSALQVYLPQFLVQ